MPLLNGGFEKDWSEESSHNVLVLTKDGPPEIKQVGNIFTPVDWLAWFYHDPGFFDQPEVKDAWAKDDPRRVHAGRKATALFTFGRKHRAGLLQQVDVIAGQVYRFSGWCHAWSNHKDKALPDRFPHPDDPRWSEGPGYNAGYCDAGIRDPIVREPETDDPWTPMPVDDQDWDSWQNFTFKVGIDPLGGTDPLADSVVWGQAAHIYNDHHLIEVEAEAKADKVTVFFFSETMWAFKHNDAYCDSFELEEIGSVVPPGECPGDPRIQYKRTSVLFPPNVTLNQVKHALDVTWDGRFTVGYSADDAGMGNLHAFEDDPNPEMSPKKVIAIYPDKWPGDLGEFFETYYADPPVEYAPVVGNGYQVDGRLRAHVFLARNLGKKLLYPTTHMPPRITDEFGVRRVDYNHNGLDFASVPDDFALSVESGQVIVAGYNPDEPWYGIQVRVESTTELGDVYLTRYAHLVDGSVAVNEGDMVKAGDRLGRCNNTGASTGPHLHIDIKFDGNPIDPEMVIDLDVDEPPEPPIDPPNENPPAWRERVSLHLQKAVPGDMEFIKIVKPTVVKLVLNFERAEEIKKASPDTLVIARQWPDGDYWEDPNAEQGARGFLGTFEDSLKRLEDVIDYAESVNEKGIGKGNIAGIMHTVDFDSWFIRHLADLNIDVKAIVANAPVGNPEHGPETRLLIPLARIAEEYGAGIGYHGYGYVLDGHYDEGTWLHYAGRALESWDKEFRSEGIHVNYFIGEAGPYATAGAGWKHELVFDGNWNDHARYIQWMKDKLYAWNLEHQNRAIVATWFTFGGGSNWEWFEMKDHIPQLIQLLTGG